MASLVDKKPTTKTNKKQTVPSEERSPTPAPPKITRTNDTRAGITVPPLQDAGIFLNPPQEDPTINPSDSPSSPETGTVDVQEDEDLVKRIDSPDLQTPQETEQDDDQ